MTWIGSMLRSRKQILVFLLGYANSHHRIAYTHRMGRTAGNDYGLLKKSHALYPYRV